MLALFLATDGFVVNPRVARPFPTVLFAELPDIMSMKATEMRKELMSYGVPTKSLFEKSEFAEALKQARTEGKKEKEPKAASSTSSSSSTDSGGGSSSSSSSSSSREERYNEALKAAKTMKVLDLKKELQARGIKTSSFFEKSEFVTAYAEAVADNKTGSGAGGSRRQEEPMDPSYRDVVMIKVDRRQLAGLSVIDVTLAR
jgi:predicted HTH domain antitoxin